MEKVGDSDSGMSGHIKRIVVPKNADVNRTEAIQHCLETAGLQRKIGKNQVCAVRILLTGSPDDMIRRLFNGEYDVD